MPVQHTNRKGQTYTLHLRERNGKPRYVFCRSVGDGALDAIPEGHEVREAVNGQVSLAKTADRVITGAEESAVREQLPAHCRIEVKGRVLLVHEPQGHAGEGLEGASPFLRKALAAALAKRARYEAVLKFTLLDADERTFEVVRMRYTGNGGWSHPLAMGTLRDLAVRFVPHVGKDSFFRLM